MPTSRREDLVQLWLARRITGTAARVIIQPDVDLTVQKSSCGQHYRARAKAEADRKLQEVEAKIARLDREVAELRQAARRDSDAEAERLLASGRVEIEKIRQAGRAELAASERAAQQELRAIAASMAVERAGALVRSRMNREIRAKIFRSFLGELGRSAN